MRIDRWLLGLAAFWLASSLASAQTGGITVIVTGADGAPLPGATVTLSHELGYVKTTADLTDRRGIVGFPVLRPGPGYSVEVSLPGYGATRESGLRVRLNDNLKIPIQLADKLEEQVKVVATRDLIKLETSEASTKFSDTFIGDLPVPGRFYQNVLTMAPGVQDADGDGNPNVHGSRNRDFSAMVGGVRNVDPLTGQWMSRINPNSIEEMEIITAGAGVEFGRAQGGFARIVQKQGSNTFEGTLDLIVRSSKLDGNGAVNLTSLPQEDVDWFQPAVQLSGPIIRDRLWFRLSHEYRNVDTPIPVPSGFEVKNKQEWTHSDQITWQVSPRNKLAFQFEADPQRVRNAEVSAFRGRDSALATRRSGETYKLTWTAPYSPRVLVETTLAWQDLNRGQSPNTLNVNNTCVAGDNIPLYVEGSQCTDEETGTISGSYYRTQDDHSQRLTVSSTATLYGGSFWGMDHQFKMGFVAENERYFRNLEQQPFGSFTRNPPGSIPGFSNTRMFFARVSIPPRDDVRATGTNWGFFVEDQFKPTSNLAITLGARVDREELNSEGRLTFGANNTVQDQRDKFERNLDAGILNSFAHVDAFVGFEQREIFETEMKTILCDGEPLSGNCALMIGNELARLFTKTSELYNLRAADDIRISNTNYSPSLAVAWSPWKNGKTAFKVAAGRHYNLIPLVVPLIELEPALATVNYINEGPGSGGWRAQNNITVPDVQTVSRDLRTPYQDEFTFAIERELWAETSISVRYIRRKFKDQLQDTNINQDVGDYGRCLRQLSLPTPQNPHPWIARSPVNPSNGFSEGTVSSSFTVDPCPGFCSDEVEDDWLRDPFTGIRYPDTRPGPGDGWDARLGTSLPWVPGYRGHDDCTGAVPSGEDPELQTQFKFPDGTTDLYIQNPFFGDIYSVGNLNAIDYEATVIELVRRLYRSWQMNASYTLSRARGNGEDFFQTLGDDPSLQADVQGFQSYDQRHVVKVNATTVTPWGLRLGTSVTWQSGLPYSSLVERFVFDTAPLVFDEVGLGGLRGRVRQSYPSGSRNDRRNPSYWNIDVKATKEFNVGDYNFQLFAEVFNVLDDGTYSIFSVEENQGLQVNGVNGGAFRFGRQWQLGLKASF